MLKIDESYADLIESDAPARREPILQPGRNCWRVEAAPRAAVLVDGASYFGALEATLRKARRSVLIAGWDFDSRIRLRQDAPESESPQLGEFLLQLVEANPQLEVRILVWSVAVVHAPSAPTELLIGREWLKHPRITLKLDNTQPLYAAHHQKIVCVDDKLAFVGGIDLTVGRWDRDPHAPEDPARLDPDGERYDPVHDVQMAVDGDAARAVAELFRARWTVATGETSRPEVVAHDPWPDHVAPDFRDAFVGVARTMPGYAGRSEVTEVATLNTDALLAAQRIVYIEAQYLTTPAIGRALIRLLAKPDGPEVVVVMTRASRGFVEHYAMGSNRDRLIRRLKRSDHHGRLRVCFPVVTDQKGEEQHVMVHAKVIIVDDVFMRIGSSNLNNRSIALDTECDLAIEGMRPAHRDAIARVRDTLMAEHVGADAATLRDAVERHGSYVDALDALGHDGRRLHCFEGWRTKGPTRPIFGTFLLDPRRPFWPSRLRRKPKRIR
ncbi:phospholipase D-like domain-containing protein [Alsobacter metallidurans]|uniref:phospholipase D-like domain-containing protein n=1 Tax=Alsobacter metallidurans TaxID=340221 RepID=UPI001FCE9A48|nr:phospholipase D-like domain-containing protein [Alsobacter metallidurans]